MQITEQQADMIMSLLSVIKDAWGIGIGLSTPFGAAVGKDDEFIVYDKIVTDSDAEIGPDADIETTCHLVHKLDFQRIGDILVCDDISEYPLHDDKVQAFWERLNNALMDGEIAFCPAVTRNVRGKVVTLTKEPANRYAVRIESAGMIEMFSFAVDELDNSNRDRFWSVNKQEIKQIIEDNF